MIFPFDNWCAITDGHDHGASQKRAGVLCDFQLVTRLEVPPLSRAEVLHRLRQPFSSDAVDVCIHLHRVVLLRAAPHYFTSLFEHAAPAVFHRESLCCPTIQTLGLVPLLRFLYSGMLGVGELDDVMSHVLRKQVSNVDRRDGLTPLSVPSALAVMILAASWSGVCLPMTSKRSDSGTLELLVSHLFQFLASITDVPSQDGSQDGCGQSSSPHVEHSQVCPAVAIALSAMSCEGSKAAEGRALFASKDDRVATLLLLMHHLDILFDSQRHHVAEMMRNRAVTAVEVCLDLDLLPSVFEDVDGGRLVTASLEGDAWYQSIVVQLTGLCDRSASSTQSVDFSVLRMMTACLWRRCAAALVELTTSAERPLSMSALPELSPSETTGAAGKEATLCLRAILAEAAEAQRPRALKTVIPNVSSCAAPHVSSWLERSCGTTLADVASLDGLLSSVSLALFAWVLSRWTDALGDQLIVASDARAQFVEWVCNEATAYVRPNDLNTAAEELSSVMEPEDVARVHAVLEEQSRLALELVAVSRVASTLLLALKSAAAGGDCVRDGDNHLDEDTYLDVLWPLLTKPLAPQYAHLQPPGGRPHAGTTPLTHLMASILGAPPMIEVIGDQGSASVVIVTDMPASLCGVWPDVCTPRQYLLALWGVCVKSRCAAAVQRLMSVMPDIPQEGSQSQPPVVWAALARASTELARAAEQHSEEGEGDSPQRKKRRFQKCDDSPLGETGSRSRPAGATESLPLFPTAATLPTPARTFRSAAFANHATNPLSLFPSTAKDHSAPPPDLEVSVLSSPLRRCAATWEKVVRDDEQLLQDLVIQAKSLCQVAEPVVCSEGVQQNVVHVLSSSDTSATRDTLPSESTTDDGALCLQDTADSSPEASPALVGVPAKLSEILSRVESSRKAQQQQLVNVRRALAETVQAELKAVQDEFKQWTDSALRPVMLSITELEASREATVKEAARVETSLAEAEERMSALRQWYQEQMDSGRTQVRQFQNVAATHEARISQILDDLGYNLLPAMASRKENALHATLENLSSTLVQFEKLLVGAVS